MRASVGWRILLLIGIALIGTQNRGGMLAVIIPLTFAMIATGRLRKLAAIVVTTGGLIGLAYMRIYRSLILVPPRLPRPARNQRNTACRRILQVFSLDERTPDITLETTKPIGASHGGTRSSAIHLEGPYFWTGKGFGINLAADDGFVVGDPNGPPLRNPHNAHFTMLARAGVPGLALWLLTLGIWSATLLVNMVRARRFGDHAWADFFVLIFCYALAFIIDGTFDVALEGPMAGIWFWSLFGTGIGATMIYRASLQGIEQRGSWQATTQAVGSA